MKALEASKC